MRLEKLKAQLSDKQQRIEQLSQRATECYKTFSRCDDELQGLGPKKRGKPPEVVAEIQARIDELRAIKAPAYKEYVSLQKELSKLRAETKELSEQIDRIETLDAQQAERDRFANPQSNNTGRTPNRQRKKGWF